MRDSMRTIERGGYTDLTIASSFCGLEEIFHCTALHARSKNIKNRKINPRSCTQTKWQQFRLAWRARENKHANNWND